MRRKVASSRLTRTNEKQNKKQALIFTIGIVILIGILIQFGPLLVNIFGNAVYTLRGGDKNDNSQLVGQQLIQPPSLLGVPEATQSSHISFSGVAPSTKGTVELYVNGDLEKEIAIHDKTDFNVESISLNKGQNTLKARFVKGDKTSEFTTEYQIEYLSGLPKLEVDFPVDNATFTRADKSITVTGTTDPDNTVLVNSFRAIVDSEGKFSYLLQLNDGDNQIVIQAQNPAGTSTQKQLKVTYNP
jgi:hypothetical protein